MVQTVVIGQLAEIDIAIQPEVWQQAVNGLQLRLLAPSGVESVVTDVTRVDRDHYRVRPLLEEPGRWEYQWETPGGVVGYGRIRVRSTGFSR